MDEGGYLDCGFIGLKGFLGESGKCSTLCFEGASDDVLLEAAWCWVLCESEWY